MKGMSFFNDLEALDPESKYLVHKAKEATPLSYSPYSKFEVGVAVLLEDDTVVLGANQENASYPLCMCGERVALYAVASQYPGKKIKKLAVVARKKNHKELIGATACGACRQVIAEFESRQKSPIQIIMFGEDSRWIKCENAETLLPLSFNSTNLLN